MYSQRKRREALDLWFEHLGEMSIKDFVGELGYPCATTMSRWIREDPRHDPDKPRYSSVPVLTKLEAIRRVSEGASTAAAAAGAGVSPHSVEAWCDKFAKGGTAALLPRPSVRKEAGVAGRRKGEGRRPSPLMQAPPEAPGELPDDPAALKALVRELQMDNALLREVLDVLKADPGCDPADLTYRERSLAVFRLSDRFPQRDLQRRIGVAKSTYHYEVEAMTRPDAGDWLGEAVEEEFRAEHCSRGYRVVTERLRRREEPIVVSEKRVRAKMRERGLEVAWSRKPRRYSSYAGEPDERPANLPLRGDGTHDFSASAPNELWVSDITEFKLPDDPRKTYLSPVIDMSDGKPVGWAISGSPDAELANSSLLMACGQLRPGDRPVCHTDGGCHYRWPGWKSICEGHGVTRSMSRKGRSPDNAACEGFFGNLKNEFYHGRDWRGVTQERFIALLDWWMRRYSSERLKAFREDGRLVYDTIDGRRRRLGLTA